MSAIKYVAYGMHASGLVLSVVNVFFQIQFLRTQRAKRKKLSVGDSVTFVWMMVIALNSIAYNMGITSGYSRASFTTTGELGGPPTAICYIQSGLIPFCTMCVAGYATMTALHVYFNVVKGFSTSKMRRVEKYMHLYVFSVPTIAVATQFAIATPGPLGMWCWIPCEETGVPSTYLNPGRCWARLTLYLPLIANCVAGVIMLIPMLILLIKHMKKTKATNTGGHAAKKGFKKTVLFLMTFCLITALASVLRVRDTLSPNPDREGKIGSTELSAALISLLLVSLFSLNRWYVCGRKKIHYDVESSRKTMRNTPSISSTSNKELTSEF